MPQPIAPEQPPVPQASGYETEDARDPLPRGPLVALFAFSPLWWVAGVVDVVVIVVAVWMSLAMATRTARLRSPRGLGVWALFLVWVLASAAMLRDGAVAFGHRYLVYLACTVVLVYVFNARRRLTERYVCGIMTAFWVFVVVGGILGLLYPAESVRTLAAVLVESTPLGSLVPDAIRSNELFQQMIIRPLAQFNPEGFFAIEPRPSAPFIYTNSWGNAFSMLVPFVLVYLMHVRRERRRFWLVAAMLPVSVVPALLTLNRGMFLGLGIAAVYGAVRLAMTGRWRALGALGLLSLVVAAALVVLPVRDRLDDRLSELNSTDARATLYQETVDNLPESPLLGFGGPTASERSGAPPVGTQGQFWMVLYSHGVVGALLFMGWFAYVFLTTLRRVDLGGIAFNTTLLVANVEQFYYGLLPSGLPIIMVAAAMALRPAERPEAPVPVPAEPAQLRSDVR